MKPYRPVIINCEDGRTVRTCDCVAFWSEERREWIDPFGGMFKAEEQEELTDFAEGRCLTLSMSPYPRLIVERPLS